MRKEHRSLGFTPRVCQAPMKESLTHIGIGFRFFSLGHRPEKWFTGLRKLKNRDSTQYRLGLTIPESAVEENLQKVKTTSEANKRELAQEESGQIVRSVT